MGSDSEYRNLLFKSMSYSEKQIVDLQILMRIMAVVEDNHNKEHIGWLAEKENLQVQYQTNSTKWKRILSLFYLGYRIIVRAKNKIKIDLIQSVIFNFPDF